METFTIQLNNGKIISAGLHCIPAPLRVHSHDVYEMELVLSGSGSHVINDVPYTFSPGDLYLLTPTDYHEYWVSERSHVYSIMFEESLVSRELIEALLDRHNDGALLVSLPEEAQARLCGLFEALIREETLLQNQTNFPLHTHRYLGNLIDCILIELLRALEKVHTADDPSPVIKAISYIEKHFAEPITLSGVAEMFHLSDSYFSRLFHKERGKTFIQYVNELRLRQAGRLLVTTDRSILEIALMCGFNSYAHFMRSFRQHYQTSPRQYRLNGILPE